jgi:Flp pilus assembly protein protease CpaA
VNGTWLIRQPSAAAWAAIACMTCGGLLLVAAVLARHVSLSSHPPAERDLRAAGDAVPRPAARRTEGGAEH